MAESEGNRQIADFTEDYRIGSRVQRDAAGRIGGHCKQGTKGDSHHEDRRWEEFVFHGASSQFQGRSQYCGGTINIIERGLEG
jgi:hypothetical protein